MNIRTPCILLFAFGLILASPLAAREQGDADSNQDGYVTREEASAHSQRRFAEISEDGDQITLRKFIAAMVAPEAGSAEAGITSNPETAFSGADLDRSGRLNREEWMRWREKRFDEAVGSAERIVAGLYKTLYPGT